MTKVIKYEDLVIAPEEVMRATLRSFELDVEQYDYVGIDQQPLRGSSSVRDGGDEVTWQPVVKPQHFQSSGKWGDWSHYRKRRFMSIAGATLVAAGYKTDGECAF